MSENPPSSQWYVLQVLSPHEKRVKKTLEDDNERKMNSAIEEVVLPIENVSEVKNGKQRIVEKKLWPGYLLVRMKLDDELWIYINSIAGVVGFLGGGRPTPLNQAEVQSILLDLAEKRHKVTQKHKFEVGDPVKIIDGVFVNFTGTVTEIFADKGRLSVLVSIFGRDTRVDDLEFGQVETIVDGGKV